MPAEVVAELVRSGFVEGRHHGSVVALESDGSVAWSVGEVATPMLPRSCNKPLQAAAMVGLGLRLSPELLALASASHSGQPLHLDGVRRMLGLFDLDEADLQCPADWPLMDAEKERVLREGGGPTPVSMNCSGKHAAMLATCRIQGWPIEDYLNAAHPLQRAIADRFEKLTGEPIAIATTDGCGAPLLATSLTGLARAFRALATARSGPESEVAEAIRRHPEYVSGTERDEYRLLRAVPGAIAKAGAEACYVVAVPDGRAVALKIEDGGVRARPVVMAAALRRLGIDAPDERYVVRGGGLDLGALRAVM